MNDLKMLQLNGVVSLTLKCLLLLLYVASCSSSQVDNSQLKPSSWEPKITVCSTDDLGHSRLVPYDHLARGKLTSCPIWPSDRKKIIHMASTRSGERFEVCEKQNLNYIMTPQEEHMNINSTLRVNTKSKGKRIHGFGTTMNLSDIFSKARTVEEGLSEIFKDYFAQSQLGLTFLRLELDKDFVSKHNIAYVLSEIDKMIQNELTWSNDGDRLGVMFSILGTNMTQDIVEILRGIWNALNTSSRLECFAITIDKEWIFSNPESVHFLEEIRLLMTTKYLMSIVDMNEAPFYADHLNKNPNTLDGLIIKSDFSSPYEILKYIKNLNGSIPFFTLGSDKLSKTDYGDWNNAKDYAVEIMNHLKHGSTAFIQPLSFKRILPDMTAKDSPIYKLPAGHFRGPMFYALGHYSLHLKPGSKILETEVRSSPNMFGAKYISFLSGDSDHVVTIVNNDNEHILPFQLVIDGVVVTQIDIKPKSLNTIVARLI